MDEYNKVTVEHKDELRRYHNNQSAKNGDQGNKTNEGNKKQDKSIKKIIETYASKNVGVK